MIFCLVLLSLLSTKVNAQHFNFEGGNPSEPFWTLYIAEATLNSTDLVAGDEIAIFDGEIMVGAITLTQVCTPENQFDNVLLAFNTLASGNPGYTPGNDVFFKCWDASLEIEIPDFEISFDNPYGDAWVQNVFPSEDGEYSIVHLSFNWITIGIIAGTVTNATIAEPIEGALVTVEGTSFSDITASDGTYLIEDVETGIYTLTANAAGYYPETITGVEVLTFETTTVDFNLLTSQTYNLVEGYQMVSSHMIAENPDMQNILEGILDNLDFVRNSDGYMLRKIGPNWINSIGDWVTTEGYLFKMNNADSFEISGEAINVSTPIELSTGYQIISYLPPQPLDCEVVFMYILDNLDFVRNTGGYMLQKIGPNWINNIANMQPGEGYLVKMNNADELIYSSFNYPPEPPSSPIPEDGAENQSIEIDLSWTCTDPEGYPLTYDIYFGTEATPPIVITGQAQTTYDPGTLEYYTEYFWKIVAKDDHSNTTEGAVWSFTTIENYTPEQPSSPIPEDGAVNQSLETDLSWTCTDPEGDPLTYDIYFGTESTPPILITGQVETTCELETLEYNTEYFWKIVAHDDHSNTTEGLVWSFTTIENYPPEPPSSPIPEDGDENQLINVDISWTCTDPEGDPLNYDIYFGTEATPPQVTTGQTETTYNPGTLQSNTEYFWKIVAHDDHSNTTEGAVWSFITEAVCGDPFIDPRDGQAYITVLIGDQCWMAENINIGTMISGSQNMSNNGLIEKYCYDDDPANCDIYGSLYQWNEMMQYTTMQGVQGICPSGWHIPTDDEWKILEGTVDSQYPVGDPIWNNTEWRGFDVGLNLKSISGWYSAGNGVDLFGFTALPGGLRMIYGGSFLGFGQNAYFWSSTEYDDSYCYRNLYYSNESTYRIFHSEENLGFSVRCLKD